MAAAAPVVLFCNYVRLLVFGLVTIYGRTEPLSVVPRIGAVMVCLLLVYGLSVLLLWILNKIIVAGPEGGGETRAASLANA